MPSFATIATAFVSSLTLASAAFSATSKNNVVYYWGQGPDQADLSTACSNPAVDIVVIGFINVYPDQGNHSYPGSNFGNACDGTTYTTVPGLFSGSSGEETELLKKCDGINPGIKVCQAAGKKVLLSLGGGYPHNGWLKSETSANDFADFLWGAFGPQKSTWVNSGKPRPFGDAIVDGFDFDIETYSFATTPTDSNGQTLTAPESYGYDYMIARLRSHYATVARTYYISGAPQCIISDVHLGPSIANSWYDFLFVQLYNTPECSARASLTPGKSTFTLDKWEAVVAQNPNPNIRVFLGLPASTKASASADYYLTPSEVYTLTEPLYSSMEHFGGIMLWEATYAARNTICGQDYTGWMEKVLGACASNKALVTACPSSSSSSSIIRSTSSVQSSTSSRISTTSSAQISSSSSAFSSSSSSKVSSSSSAVNSPVVTSSSSS
ncbi:glycoside hydrolase [Tothia fuscella]|uniref:chitinase n=1 Tax=Tothia fuscella TaxID=1048955 RepID=A0A9P4P527_9PEZI|nr:glycoside hydrolase [Tothia fuscella]